MIAYAPRRAIWRSSSSSSGRASGVERISTSQPGWTSRQRSTRSFAYASIRGSRIRSASSRRAGRPRRRARSCPPRRRSLTMSQWTALTFVPPMNGKPLPRARWIVPSIFSSKSVFCVCRWMPGLQPMPNSPSTRAPSSVSSVFSRKSSSRRRRRVDDPAALEAEADVLDGAAAVARPGTPRRRPCPRAESSTGL